AAQIEDFVVGRIRHVGQNPSLLQQTLAEARRQSDARFLELDAERRGLERETANLHREARKLARQTGKRDDGGAIQLTELRERMAGVETRLNLVKDQAAAIRREQIDEADSAATLAAFDPLWAALTPAERARVVQLLVERVEYDGEKGKVRVTFSPTG